MPPPPVEVAEMAVACRGIHQQPEFTPKHGDVIGIEWFFFVQHQLHTGGLGSENGDGNTFHIMVRFTKVASFF